MDLNSILEKFSTGNAVTFLIVLASFVQISPIKVNPWTWIAKWFGKQINGEVMEEMRSVKSDLAGVHIELETLKEREEVKDADAARNRILRFDDELRQHIFHSKEYFDQILVDIDMYLAFCREHDNYPNSKADSAIKHILECYEKIKKENNFI